MALSEQIKNPYVIGGGVLLGVIMLLSRRGGSVNAENLGASLQSQQIASATNVQLAATSLQYQAAYASEVSARIATIAGLKAALAENDTQFYTSLAVKNAQSQAAREMAFYDFAAKLHESNAARDVAMQGISANLAAYNMGALLSGKIAKLQYELGLDNNRTIINSANIAAKRDVDLAKIGSSTMIELGKIDARVKHNAINTMGSVAKLAIRKQADIAETLGWLDFGKSIHSDDAKVTQSAIGAFGQIAGAYLGGGGFGV